jgi:hypothetical protein
MFDAHNMETKMMKTYTLICPDPECEHEFHYEADPAALADGGDLITCPECEEPWEWEYDAETDTLELLFDEFLLDEEDPDDIDFPESLEDDDAENN